MAADTISAPINAVPFGLLDLLQTKALGRNPNELMQAVRPTVEMSQFWASGAPTQYFTTLATPVTGAGVIPTAGTFTTVPPGKTWVPISFVTYALGIGAGDNARVHPAIYLPGTVPANVAELGDNTGLASNNTIYNVGRFDFWSPIRAYGEGFHFGIFIANNLIVVTGQSVILSLRYLEF